MNEKNREIDVKNLQEILGRVKSIHGVKCHDEVRNIVSKFPDASNFNVVDKTDGEHKDYAGTKIKGYYESDDSVFIMIAESERGEGKDKKVYKRYLSFKKNETSAE